MSEFEKLEKYLIDHDIPFTKVSKYRRNQLIVRDDNDRYSWDAICQFGSYGYEQGLLEVMGSIVDPEEEGDTVKGWLSADDIIYRLEHGKWEEKE